MEKRKEPLLSECRAFINALTRISYLTDGEKRLRVLRVLQRAQEYLDGPNAISSSRNYFAHETGIVDTGCSGNPGILVGRVRECGNRLDEDNKFNFCGKSCLPI